MGAIGTKGNILIVQIIDGKLVPREFHLNSSLENAARFESLDEIPGWLKSQKLTDKAKENLRPVQLLPKQPW